MEGVMTRRTEDTPAAVPLAQQAGTAELHSLWMTAKPCVWKARMLTTLIEGVEGGKWFRLFDKVFSELNLFAAFQQVARNDGAPGVDHVSVHEFGQQIPENIWQLSDSLKTDAYRPQALRRVDHLLKAGFVHVIDADLKAYFDSIPHGQLLAQLKTKIADGRVLTLKHWPRKKSIQKCERQSSQQDQTYVRGIPAVRDRAVEPDAPRLVRVL